MTIQMRKNLISLLLLLTIEVFAAPVDDFVIVVQSDNLGETNDTSFRIPTAGGGYDYNVDCNDDGINEATALGGDYTCDFSTLGGIGTYTIRIKDNTGIGSGFPRIHFNLVGDVDKVIDLQQWGTGQWQSMANAFQGAINMTVSATDIPDLSNVTDMSRMFRGTVVANPDTSGWDTSQVVNMTRMFLNTTMANPDTSGWDTSQVTDMSLMFRATVAANPDTSGWDTSQVTNMSGMFRESVVANPDTSGWNTSMVISMNNMFNFTDVANPDTSGWNTSSVTDMSEMFMSANSANPDMSNWDVTSLLNASRMFDNVTLPTSTYDAMLNNWGSQALQSNVPFSGGNSLYCSGEAARTRMIDDFGWFITDNGNMCSIEVPQRVPTLSNYMLLALLMTIMIFTNFVLIKGKNKGVEL